MGNSKKQMQLMADLSETILQFRMDGNPTYIQHLKGFRKELKKMLNQGTIQPGILHLLVKNQQYKIKNRINREYKSFIRDGLILSIRIQCIQKTNCEVRNEEIWQLAMLSRANSDQTLQGNTQAMGMAIAQIIEFLLTNLFCYSLLPIKRYDRHKYMIDYKIFFQEHQSSNLINFESVRILQVWGLQQGLNFGGNGISIKYFSNQTHMEEDLKTIIDERTQQFIFKKHSSDSTVASSSKISFREIYDTQLNITILSSSDEENDEKESGLIEITEEKDQEFEILLMQNFIASEDKAFLQQSEEFWSALVELEKQNSEYFSSGEPF